MLLQFTIKNHYSFHGEATLDMVATKNTEHAYSLIQGVGFGVLPIAAIYGANGAGKSNFVDAFTETVKFILNSIDYNKNIGDDKPELPFVPFIYTSTLFKTPIESEMVFLLDGVEYRYGFSAANEKIEEEYLDCKPNGKKSFVRVFLRQSNKKIIVGTSSAITTWERNILKLIGPMISDTDLVLTFLCRRQSDEEDHRYKRINSWLRSIRRTSHPFSLVGGIRVPINSNLKQLYDKNSDLSERHLKFIKKADPAIQGLCLKKERDSGGKEYWEVYTEHRFADSDIIAPVPASIESEGTKAAIRMYPDVTAVLDSGGVLVVDELDRSLHPLLLLEIIRMFTNPEINANGAQLICTLHNVLVMDKKHLRRDEIWFVEKNTFGESEIYALADIIVNDKKIRGDVDYCKQYILGTFGAIPDFMNI